MVYLVGVSSPHVAIGTSLFAVTAFELTATLNYAFSSLVDWPLAGIFIAGGLGDTALARRISGTSHLTAVFVIPIFGIAA